MYLRLSLLGTLPADEKWTVNPAFHFNLAFAPTWDQASGDAIVSALLAAVTSTTLGGNLRALLSTSAQLMGFRLEGRDEDETLLGVSEGYYAVPIAGTGTMSKTLQAATVISLRTNTPGARGRGRLYWPALGATVSGTTGRMTAPTPTSVVTDAVALLVLIQNTIEANAGVFPFTDVLLAVRSVTDHASRTVTRLQVGDVVDTQRRRRDTLPENYTAATYP